MPLGRVLALTVAALAVLLGGAAACGGAPGPAAGRGSVVAAAPTRPSGNGSTISVESGSAIVGQQGKLLVVFASARYGASRMARACVRITSDRFVVPATVMTDVGTSQDACGSTPSTVFPPGTYTLAAGIYGPPYSTPEVESSQAVTVAGSDRIAVKVDGAALSR